MRVRICRLTLSPLVQAAKKKITEIVDDMQHEIGAVEKAVAKAIGKYAAEMIRQKMELLDAVGPRVVSVVWRKSFEEF